MDTQNTQPITSSTPVQVPSAQPPPSAPVQVPASPQPEHSSKRPLTIVLGILLLLGVIGLLAYIVLFAQNKSNTTAVVPSPLPTRAAPTPTIVQTEEELIDAIDTSDPEADLTDIETDLKQLQ